MKVPARRQLSVEVWQIYIGGKKPERLPGARDDLISKAGEPATPGRLP
ncbi:MAG: hypothetical protein HS113_15670 [Verrucomicrobiales bacterium]|nr:hypothetical protein [Verrucomicrobiales bacterium]